MKLNEIILAHQMDPNSNGMFMRGKAVANGFTHQHSGWCHCIDLISELWGDWISTLNQHKLKHPNALAFQTFQTFNALQNSTVCWAISWMGMLSWIQNGGGTGNLHMPLHCIARVNEVSQACTSHYCMPTVSNNTSSYPPLLLAFNGEDHCWNKHKTGLNEREEG